VASEKKYSVKASGYGLNPWAVVGFSDEVLLFTKQNEADFCCAALNKADSLASSAAADEVGRLREMLDDAVDVLGMRAKPCSNCPEFGDDVAVIDGQDQTCERFRTIEGANAWIEVRRREMASRILVSLTTDASGAMKHKENGNG